MSHATIQAMPDLFDAAADKAMRAAAPLADRVRPSALDGFVGQAHMVGPGTALRRATSRAGVRRR